ncbi:pilus assembly protein CpaC [Selenomonas ruminantium]|uniref:Pilus assembly protein CpaC n=1 Tax=Selenomonas ruminantium TaxID=971 RepID=A0A1M6S372_SELRU|nr:pilus assembly protein N-terminal domain-containing protein [Selenomonas ruminantium]SHK39272.1 pilus assembly protein CpaC [Selenomonas ruminantium]
MGKLRGLITGLLAGCCLWNSALAADLLSVGVHSSRYVSMPSSITRIAIGDPDIATIVQVPSSKTEFLVVAHKAGTTSLFVWTLDGSRYEYIVGVSPEDVGQARVIQEAINLPGVRVKMVDGKVLLSGTVENQYERNYAVRTAQLFVKNADHEGNISVGSNTSVQMATKAANDQRTGNNMGVNNMVSTGSVIDLLHMRHPSQIKLEAQVIAINPKEDKDLGFVYGHDAGSNLLSTPGVFYAGESYGTNGTRFGNNPWKWLTEHRGGINMALRALVSQNRAKILSRPSITTMSGEAAIIQVGGEIPYTTRDGNGNPNTEFKDYGIILQFKPVVDAENRIVSSIHTEVSMPSGESVDKQPILDRRRADAVVTVASGSTMVIGGLMDSRDYKIVRKFPFLGDMPILGEFFKYTSHNKDKQELIILVTPTLVTEESASVAGMSGEMKGLYDKGRQEKAAQKQVDLNEDLSQDDDGAEKGQEDKDQDKKDIHTPAAEMAQDDDSLLGKYLRRDVLPRK